MKDELAGWKDNATQMGVVAMWMKTFASEIIGHVLNGRILDDAALRQLKTQCLRDLKNIDVTGISIQQEAEFLRKAIEHVEQMIDMAIADGWKLKKM